MGKKRDLMGQTFNNLTVIQEMESRDKNGGNVNWLCKCSCGNEKVVDSDSLTSGHTKSCGCRHIKKRVGQITPDIIGQIKRCAKDRDLEYNLTMEYIWELYEKQKHRCALSGQYITLPPLGKKNHLPNRGRNRTASLDRIDSDKGYVEGNVQWVHKDINIAKQDMTDDEFINMCRNITNYQNICNKTLYLSGGFDPVHAGHVKMIEEAAKIGKVVLILNSDDWLIRKKGYSFMSWEERAYILKALKGVYDVIPVKDEDGTVCDALRQAKLSSSDLIYFGNGGDRTDKNTPEKSLCEELGIEMVWGLGGGKVQSSSELVKRIGDMESGPPDYCPQYLYNNR